MDSHAACTDVNKPYKYNIIYYISNGIFVTVVGSIMEFSRGKIFFSNKQIIPFLSITSKKWDK